MVWVRCWTGPVRPWLLGPLVRVVWVGTRSRPLVRMVGAVLPVPRLRVAWVVGSVTDLVAWVVVLLLVRMLTLSTLLVGTPSC